MENLSKERPSTTTFFVNTVLSSYLQTSTKFLQTILHHHDRQKILILLGLYNLTILLVSLSHSLLL